MNSKKDINIEKVIVPILLESGIGVLPTDTLYGMVGRALDKKTVERIYKLRKRDLKKPMIVLISSLNDLKIFGIKLNSKQKKILAKFWPGKVSVVLDCSSKKFEHLHRGGKTLALRFPKDKNLISLLKKTGPLVVPSVNVVGEKPAEIFSEAKKYFGDKVDFYIDAGKMKSKPSTLVSLDRNGNITVLRPGAVKIKISQV